jgi:hypothetical protein
MSKYDNHIYLTICEASLELFKKSVFLTYLNYCRNLGSALNNDLLTKNQNRDIIKLIEVLDKIFTLSPEDTGKYIYDYFNLNIEKLIEFEKSVKITQNVFPDINKLV